MTELAADAALLHTAQGASTNVGCEQLTQRIPHRVLTQPCQAWSGRTHHRSRETIWSIVGKSDGLIFGLERTKTYNRTEDLLVPDEASNGASMKTVGSKK